jgi:hypothetical protein
MHAGERVEVLMAAVDEHQRIGNTDPATRCQLPVALSLASCATMLAASVIPLLGAVANPTFQIGRPPVLVVAFAFMAMPYLVLCLRRATGVAAAIAASQGALICLRAATEERHLLWVGAITRLRSNGVDIAVIVATVVSHAALLAVGIFMLRGHARTTARWPAVATGIAIPLTAWVAAQALASACEMVLGYPYELF